MCKLDVHPSEVTCGTLYSICAWFPDVYIVILDCCSSYLLYNSVEAMALYICT